MKTLGVVVFVSDIMRVSADLAGAVIQTENDEDRSWELCRHTGVEPHFVLGDFLASYLGNRVFLQLNSACPSLQPLVI